MPNLDLFPLPLPSQVPIGYGWEARSVSELSTKTAFETELDLRDVFLGEKGCIICGQTADVALQHCHIIMQSEPKLVSECMIRPVPDVDAREYSGLIFDDADGSRRKPSTRESTSRAMAF